MQAPEPAGVERHAMLARTGQPGRDRGVAMPEDAPRGGDVEAFRQRGQHRADARGGCLEPVERGVAAGAEGAAAGLAAEGLDALSLPVSPIADQRMDLRVRDP